jgi:hypothetical protein
LAKQPDQSSPFGTRRETGKARKADGASKRETEEAAKRIRAQLANPNAESRVTHKKFDHRILKKDVERPAGLGITVRNTKEDMEFSPTKYSPKGRKLRKEFERPRPDLPAYADANRTRRPISVTLPPDLLNQVNERCRELDVDRTAFVEAAIRLALKPS